MTDEKPPCPTTKTESCGSNKKSYAIKWLIFSLLASITTFAYDWLVHDNLLARQSYMLVSCLVTKEEILALSVYNITKHTIESAIFTALFIYWLCTKKSLISGISNCTVLKSFYFGATFGLLLAINSASVFIHYSQVPDYPQIPWLIAETIKWGVIGVMLTFLYRRYDKKA